MVGIFITNAKHFSIKNGKSLYYLHRHPHRLYFFVFSAAAEEVDIVRSYKCFQK